MFGNRSSRGGINAGLCDLAPARPSVAARAGLGFEDVAQSGKPPVRVRALNHMTLTVSDRKRSMEFYQGLFGMSVQHRQGSAIGPAHRVRPAIHQLVPGRSNARPHRPLLYDGRWIHVAGITKSLAITACRKAIRVP